MLLGGDEIGRTQDGNNNAWCQDNEISWFDWELDDDGERCSTFTRRLIALPPRAPVFRRATFLAGDEPSGSGLPDVWWFRPDGRRMTQRDWERADAAPLGVFLNGDEIPARDARRRAGRATTRSCCSSTRHHEPIDVHAADRAASARRWARRALDRDAGGAPTADRRAAPRAARRSRLARWSLLRRRERA